MEERRHGDTKDTPLVHKLSMETYNKHYAPCRTESDWLCANPDAQDAYIADPLCGDGFTVSSFRELLSAMKTCSTAEHLSHMNPSVPVLFLSGKEDAVGNFGKGVEKAAELFHNAHMKDVTVQLFDGMRHDIPEAYDFSQLFIDENYQHMGYGEDAARQIIARMKAEHRYGKILLCYIEGDEAALSLYKKLGFKHTGERDGAEIVMELNI